MTDKLRKIRTALANERYLLGILALVLAAFLALDYRLLYGKWNGLDVAIIPNLIASLLIFAAVYFFLERRGILSPSPHARMETLLPAAFERHDRIDWGEIIRNARTIDIAVFYYGRWIREHHDDFVHFFRSGGSLRIIVSDPSNIDIVATIQKHYFPHLSADELRGRIVATFDAVTAALAEAGNAKAKVAAYLFPGLLHYSFVLADDHELYLSVYEQFRRPVVQAPVFKVQIGDNRETLHYWRHARDLLIAGSRENHLH